MKKLLILIFLLSSAFIFSSFADMSQDEFYGTINSCVTNLNDSLNAISQIQGNLNNLYNFVEANFEPEDSQQASVKTQIKYLVNSESRYLDTPYSLLWDTRSILMNLTYPSSSSSVDMGVVTNIYNVLASDQNNMQSVLVDVANDLYDLLEVVGLLSSSSNSVDFTEILNSIGKVRFKIEVLDQTVSMYGDSFFEFFMELQQDIQSQTGIISQFYDSFLDWSFLVTNFNNHSSFDYSIISNYFGRPNNKYSFDRFASKLRPINNSNPIDFTFKSPYDSLQNINAANFSALLAGGFSNGLIELASINNYLYYVEKFLTTNQIDNAKINDSLYALSNMVGRIDSYVTEDFSNEFFNLCRTIEDLTNTFNSISGSLTNSNNNLSLTNIEISLETIITNQLKSLSFYSAFSNQFNTVISNQTLFSDYLFNSDNVLSDYTDGSYYDFLTNRYITGSNGSLSNWYDRIETLLAALTFSAVSQSNLTTQVDNEDDLKQRFQDILTQSVNENTQTSIIKTANDSQGAIINIVRGLSSTISSVASQHSIVFGWGDNETVKFEDFVGGNFHITVSGHGVDQFTMVGRAVSTLCWIVVTCLLVFKFSLWMARVGYKLYTFIRSVLFALWGK